MIVKKIAPLTLGNSSNYNKDERVSGEPARVTDTSAANTNGNRKKLSCLKLITYNFDSKNVQNCSFFHFRKVKRTTSKLKKK